MEFVLFRFPGTGGAVYESIFVVDSSAIGPEIFGLSIAADEFLEPDIEGFLVEKCLCGSFSAEVESLRACRVLEDLNKDMTI
jgi:hypothetical protein